MKSFLLFVIMTGSLMFVSAAWNEDDPKAETSIVFTKASWEEVVKKAQTENKVIFVDMYASWCGPCKLLKKTTFKDKEVGEFFNSHFVNAAIDGETKEGRKLIELYGITSYPTMLFVNVDGSIRKAAIGYHTANQLLTVAKSTIQ